MRKNNNATKINSKRFKKIFNSLFQCSENEKEVYRIAVEEDTNRIYSDNLLKNLNHQHFSITADLEELMIFGPGIYLMFKFLKILIPLFAIVSVLSIVNLVLLATGSYYTNNEMNTNTFEALMARTTLGNIEQPYYNVIPILNFISIVIFTAAIVYWRERQPYEVLQCCKVKLLPSYYTVKLQSIPEGYSQCQLKQFLEDLVGPVKQIYSVKQFNDDLLHYKEISEIINDYKIQRAKVDDNREERNCLNLLKLFNEFYYYYIKMSNKKNPKYQPAFAFITFSQVAHRQMLLDIYQKKTFSCTNTQLDEKYKYKDQILQFQPCQMEPEGISWENITLSTKNAFLRVSFQVLLIVIALIVSITIVYLLAIAQANFTNSEYKDYNLEDATKSKNENILKSSCISLSITDFIRNQSYCSQYQSVFIKVVLLEIFLPLIIAILKFIFIQIMKSLVSVRRHSTQIQKLQSQVFITFIFYFIVSGILQLVLNIEIVTSSGSNISIHSFFTSLFQQVYGLLPQKNSFTLQHDFTRQWFFDNSSKIILISMLSFNLSSIIDIIYSIIRKIVIQYLAAKQEVVAQMNTYLKCQTIQIQFIYAFVLNIIFFTLMFGAVIPLLWVLGFISIVILYFIQKLIFVKYCSKPLIFSHSVNHIVTRLVLFGIVLSCATAPILFGGVIDKGSITERYIRYLYYPILGGLILVYMFTKKYWLKCMTVVKQSVQIDKKRINKRLPTIFSRIEQPNVILPSYSMHQASTYQAILRVLYTMNSIERNRQTFLVSQHVDDFLTQIKQFDDQNTPFKSLLFDIKYDQMKYHKINSKFNSFGSNQKQVKNITKIYEECKQAKQKKQKHKELENKNKKIKPLKQLQKDSVIEEHSSQQDHQNQNTSRHLSNQQPKKQPFQINDLNSHRRTDKK